MATVPLLGIPPEDEQGYDLVEYALTEGIGICAVPASTRLRGARDFRDSDTAGGLQRIWNPLPPSRSE